MRYTPIKQQGRRGREMQSIRTRVWPRIIKRSRGLCEACHRGDRPLEWAHVFGRPSTGLGLGEWANTVELTMALCSAPDGSGCHQKLDRFTDPALRASLRLRAANLFALAYMPLTSLTEDLPPDDAVREIIRQLEQEGPWTWDGARMVRDFAA